MICGSYVIGSFKRSELGEDLLQRFAAHVGQHIETASVGHAHHNGLDSQFSGPVDDLLHSRDQYFTALKTKSLLG